MLLAAYFGRKIESMGSVTAFSAAKESELVLSALEKQNCLHLMPLETKNSTGKLGFN